MVEVTLYRNMRKEVNSTATPGGGNFDSSTVYSCVLFEPCSVQNPKIWLAVNIQADIHDYNYAYIPHFSRYYWVTDLSFMDGRWLVSLACDTLASFKSAIGSSEQYILRSASAYNDKIIDTIYAPDGGKFTTENTITNPFSSSLYNGTFVMGYTSASPVAGSNAYALFTGSQLTTFLSQLMGSGSYLNLDNTDLDSNVAKAILNPIQYIQSVKWYPFSITGGSSSNTFFFGWWLLSGGHSDLLLSDSFRRSVTMTIPIPKHPQAATRGAYLNLEPYSHYRVYLPVLGYVDLPASMLFDFNGLQVTYTVDILSGIAHVIIDAYKSGGDRSVTVYQSDCNMAVEIPVAQIYRDTMGSISSGASGVLGAVGSFLGGDIRGGIESLVNGGLDAATKAITPIPAFSGSMGNLGAFHKAPTLENVYQPITAEAYSLFGRPLCDKRIINTLSGFVMCGRTHIALPGATKAETQEIETYMNEGFFYE